MKSSLFNNFISLSSGKTLGYNAFTNRFIIAPTSITPLIKTIDNLDRLSVLDETARQQLIAAGFLVPESQDELAILDQEINNTDFNDTSYELCINPTLDCNFRCWYCYENHQKESELNTDILTRIEKHLTEALISPINSFYLSFFGGEPLLKFNSVCKPLILFANSICKKRDIRFRVHFTSNSYLLTPDIADFLSAYPCTFQITLDGSRKFHDKVRFPSPGVGSYDKILDNVALLADNGVIITLRINYTLGNVESVGDIVTDLINKQISHPENIVVNFQRVWQDHHNGNNEKIKLLISDFGKILVTNHFGYSIPDLSNPRISSCYGDQKNFACINYNGDFFKCTARDFTKDNRCGHLAKDGRIIWDENKEEQWLRSKFSRQICRSCRIAPICLGGCRQKTKEAPDDGQCPLRFDEARKDELILQRFETYIMNHPKYASKHND